MRKAPGAVVYRGPSRLDGAPIVAIVTFASLNVKTGRMAQAWILRADVGATEAVDDGLDRSICGDCIHRSGGRNGRSCYVLIHYGPRNVFKAFERGLYPDMTPAAAGRAILGLQLRVSAYGDPAAVPFAIWPALLEHVVAFTAYTHQWRTCDPRFASFAMASVESEREAEQAHALGYRTFRTRLATERVREDEIVCPASQEAGHRLTCDRCGLCSGAQRAGARSVAIVSHGQRAGWIDKKKRAAGGGLA